MLGNLLTLRPIAHRRPLSNPLNDSGLFRIWLFCPFDSKMTSVPFLLFRRYGWSVSRGTITTSGKPPEVHTAPPAETIQSRSGDTGAGHAYSTMPFEREML